jgi:hypothetical protein
MNTIRSTSTRLRIWPGPGFGVRNTTSALAALHGKVQTAPARPGSAVAAPHAKKPFGSTKPAISGGSASSGRPKNEYSGKLKAASYAASPNRLPTMAGVEITQIMNPASMSTPDTATYRPMPRLLTVKIVTSGPLM